MANRKLVPECNAVINQWKYEIAAELGLPVGKNAAISADTEFASELGAFPTGAIRENYWGHIATRDTGTIGGSITARLVQQAEQVLAGMK